MLLFSPSAITLLKLGLEGRGLKMLQTEPAKVPFLVL